MSANISSVAYTYPIPECFNVNDVKVMTVPALSANIEEAFKNYEKIRDNLLLQLNRIFFGEDTQYYVVPEDGHISIAAFIKKVLSEEEQASLNEAVAEAEALLAEKETELETAKATLAQKEEALAEAQQEEASVATKWMQGTATPDELETAQEATIVAQDAKDVAEQAKNQAETARDEAKADVVNARLAASKGFNAFTDCDESNTAYKFYGNQIIDQINKLSDYINEAKAILDKWNMLSGNDLSSLIHADVVHLECLDQFCNEIHKKFGSRYYYDFDEDNWKLAEDDYAGYINPGMTYEQIKDSYDAYDDLYKTNVKCNKKTAGEKVLECFNELNLLDRLKYIKVYYDIKVGKTNYVFPGSKEAGFPCVAEEGIDDTDARIANLEKFYLGYLIDRDGPVNAFCSLYEVKVRALQETLNEMSNRIKALNVYMDFVNRGLELLNQTQSDKTIEESIGKIPDGVTIALTYLCGQEMYNLFEYEGEKYLVIPSVTKDEEYVCVKADASGMRFLLGDSLENGNCKNKGINNKGLWQACSKENQDKPTRKGKNELKLLYSASETKIVYDDTSDPKKYCYKMVETVMEGSNPFSLPKALSEVATVDPKSVKNYPSGTLPTGDEKTNAQERTTIFESWTAAFNKKIGFINDAIEMINTDIEQIRNKINTYQSQANTFRNRVHDVYINSVRKIKS